MGLRPIRSLPVAALFAALFFAPAIASADEPDPDQLAAAKNLFRSGVALLNTGDYERALDYFLRSRAQVPSKQNTTDSAICLDHLGRYDEALDLYEELLLRFSSELAEGDRAELGTVMAALRGKVGSISVSANVEGRVVIDGRARGELPASVPLRVLGGKHTVRVFRDGYTAFETKVDVPVGATIKVEGHLTPLAEAGLLRVEDPASEGFDVVVDGAYKGHVPWEGTLPPGRHIVWTQRGDRGSSPRVAEVIQGQMVLLRMSVIDLGPPLPISVAPATARISLDGVPLGVRSFTGRLPVGPHIVALTEDGYFPQKIQVEVSAGSSTPAEINATLQVNPDHPRWPQPVLGHFFVGVVGGYGGGHALGSDPGRVKGDPLSGNMLGARGGYRFSSGFAAEASFGYLSFRATPRNMGPVAYLGHPIDYTLDHWIRARGVFLGFGGSYRAAVRPWLGFSPRLMLGFASVRVNDDLTGTAADASGRTLSIFVAKPKQPGAAEATDTGVVDRRFFVLPELGADITWRGFFGGVALGLAFFPGSGPVYQKREIGVTPICGEEADLGSVGCAPNVKVPAERVYHDFVLFLPQISVGYVF